MTQKTSELALVPARNRSQHTMSHPIIEISSPRPFEFQFFLHVTLFAHKFIYKTDASCYSEHSTVMKYYWFHYAIVIIFLHTRYSIAHGIEEGYGFYKLTNEKEEKSRIRIHSPVELKNDASGYANDWLNLTNNDPEPFHMEERYRSKSSKSSKKSSLRSGYSKSSKSSKGSKKSGSKSSKKGSSKGILAPTTVPEEIIHPWEYMHDGTELLGYYSLPDGVGSFPVVVIVP